MTNHDDRNYYEIQLDNKQLIFIFLIAIVICAVFFLIGVKVGKNAKELEYSLAKTNALPKEQADLPVTEKKDKNETSPEEKINPTFYQLSEKTAKESDFKPQAQKSEEPEEKKPEPKPVETNTTTIEKEVPLQEVRYSVQVMSTSYKDKALAMRDRLKAKNYPTFIRQIKEAGENVVYKVRVGSFATSAEAKDLLQKLKIQENITDAWVAQDTP
jgi:cell division septation protein DedD